jgi:hypothetical protein
VQPTKLALVIDPTSHNESAAILEDKVERVLDRRVLSCDMIGIVAFVHQADVGIESYDERCARENR